MNKLQILRNTFAEGLSDAFNIIYGNHNTFSKLSGEESTESFRFGVTDLLIFPLIGKAMVTFGFPTKLASGSTTRYCQDKERSNPFRTFIGIVGATLQLPRLLIALSLTVAISPLVLVVHALKYPYVKYLESAFFKLKGVIKNTDSDITPSNNVPPIVELETFVSSTQSSLNELRKKPTQNSLAQDITSYSMANDAPPSDMHAHQAHINPKQFFNTALDNDSQTQKKALEAGRTLGILN